MNRRKFLSLIGLGVATTALAKITTKEKVATNVVRNGVGYYTINYDDTCWSYDLSIGCADSTVVVKHRDDDVDALKYVVYDTLRG